MFQEPVKGLVFAYSRWHTSLVRTSYSELLREEWDFTAFFFGRLVQGTGKGRSGFSEHLYNCRVYEYARSTPAIVKAFARDKRKLMQVGNGARICFLVAPSVGPNAVEFGLPFPGSVYHPLGWATPEFLGEFLADRLIAPAGFPGKPFLLTQFENIYSPALNPCFPENPSIMPAYQNKKFWIDSTHHPVPPGELIHLRIRWDCSDEVILKDFKKWLKKYPRPRKAENLRGKSLAKSWKADLNALGAWRILSHYDGNVKAARVFCKDHNQTPLYDRKEDWIDARNRAQRIIDDFSRREINV
jgi:hypothetical protein